MKLTTIEHQTLEKTDTKMVSLNLNLVGVLESSKSVSARGFQV